MCHASSPSSFCSHMKAEKCKLKDPHQNIIYNFLLREEELHVCHISHTPNTTWDHRNYRMRRMNQLFMPYLILVLGYFKGIYWVAKLFTFRLHLLTQCFKLTPNFFLLHRLTQKSLPHFTWIVAKFTSTLLSMGNPNLIWYLKVQERD